jgi:hypothetical protein
MGEGGRGGYGVVWYFMLNGDGFVEIDWGTID